MASAAFFPPAMALVIMVSVPEPGPDCFFEPHAPSRSDADAIAAPVSAVRRVIGVIAVIVVIVVTSVVLLVQPRSARGLRASGPGRGGS